MLFSYTGSTYAGFAVFGFIGLTLGAITTWLTSRYVPQLPYTVVIFLEGALIAYCVELSPNAVLSGSLAFIGVDDGAIVSEGMIFIFLPVLIFGEAMNLNWHHVMSGLSQSLLLAWPGAVFGALLMAVASMYLMDWSFSTACIFGAILSATDPVAVVALLKTAGASHQLTILIIGESLLNDGSAIVLYQLFNEIQSGTQPTASYIIQFFLLTAVCSVLLGIAIGLLTNQLMRLIDHSGDREDMSVQIVITIASAYLSFILAQGYFDISGVLCASAAGLMLARYAPPFLLHHKLMHAAWGSLEWICNTLIFFFAGLAAADRSLQQDVSNAYFYQVIVLYVVLVLLRIAMLLFFYPLLSFGRIKVSFKDSIFIVWSGLRGALGIALALAFQSTKLVPPTVSNAIFLLVVGIVTLTLVINATTAKWVLRYLQLTEESRQPEEEKLKINDLLHRRFSNRTRKALAFYAQEFGCEESAIEGYCTLLSNDRTSAVDGDENTEDAFRRTRVNSYKIKTTTRNELLQIEKSLGGDQQESDDTQLLSPYLLRFLRQQFYSNLRSQYHEIAMDGRIERHSYSSHALINSTDQAMDFLSEPLKDWQFIEKEIAISRVILIIAKFIDGFTRKFCCVPTKFYGRLIAKRERRYYYILVSFIDAHEKAQRKVPTYLGGNEDDIFWLPEETQIKEESMAVVAKARELLLSKFNEDTLQKFNAQRVARLLLIEQMHTIQTMLEEGSLTPLDAKRLASIVEGDELNLNRQRKELQRAFVNARQEAHDASRKQGRILSVTDTLSPTSDLVRESIVSWTPKNDNELGRSSFMRSSIVRGSVTGQPFDQQEAELTGIDAARVRHSVRVGPMRREVSGVTSSDDSEGPEEIRSSMVVTVSEKSAAPKDI